MSLRVFTALLACRAARTAARLLRRGGTAKPGEIAMRICPDIAAVLARGVESVVVTGTNGKTTSCRMLERAFAEAGLGCAANRSGANLMSGIVTTLAEQSSLTGDCRKRYAVLECDEGWVKKVLPALKPKVLLVTNLFQDQVDRYGGVENALAAIRAGAEASPDTLLCLNADDAVSSALAAGAKNPVRRYGLSRAAGETGAEPGAREVTRCMLCGAELEYDYVNYAHLGGFRCPGCGHHREDPAVCVEKIDELGLDSSTVELSVDGKTEKVYVNQPAIYNIYNAAGAVAAATAMGIPAEDAERAVGSFDCGFGRMEKFALGAAGARMVLVKNAAGTNQVIGFLARQSAPFDLVFVTNNRVSDGTDTSWLADAEFETLAALPALGAVTVSGTCAEQMTARLRAAGVAEDKLHLQPDLAAVAETVSAAERPVFILPSYTGMMELRPLLLRRCGGKEFWE